MNKIRKGDEIIVITGRDKGKRGTITLRTEKFMKIVSLAPEVL